ncbi:metal-dependent amidase/aminoacylase/carboxypeptidase [Eremomyces bilateralis CBS 781.70]|uniref:Metal-dependent amidase/aminoacylase/carboxypeptidase n=1 Tax=Eremomyces bilateralis CBS 781.70 TaxID=1392243 RepID=A0A6G1FX63_9PEZI|nr:metal-dependent amidase/aminoacylase/carboxypeptidase [Eremomyces bilateralis CBS 781.70]KAF1810209.1 metal-dependent amidase/aminoacylase/carboxypeptidase [Eremomyces bilateralis CBS 781.70]
MPAAKWNRRPTHDTGHLPSLDVYQDLYKHFHAHPELSHLESETAARVTEELRSLGSYDIFTNIGETHGVAAVLKNGEGATVLLRADMDGLPVEEKTGLEYASKTRMRDSEGVERPTMHACGHDMHITSLLATAKLMLDAKKAWRGTLILCFQPAEEKGAGAKAMVEGNGGLYTKVPIPDVVLGAHVMPGRAGSLETKRGLVASAADSFRVTLHGRSGHGSQPHRTIDPIVMAASTVLRLQTIVSREVDPYNCPAVVTVGSIHAGDAENIIPEHAEIKLNIRTLDPETRAHVLEGTRRIINAEAMASNAPQEPELESLSNFPFLNNDDEVTTGIETTFAGIFPGRPHGYSSDGPRLGGSEDFGILATSVNRPSCFWTYGGTDPAVWDEKEKEGKLKEIPINHSSYFAPVIMPTLKVAIEGLAGGALTWLAT